MNREIKCKADWSAKIILLPNISLDKTNLLQGLEKAKQKLEINRVTIFKDDTN